MSHPIGLCLAVGADQASPLSLGVPTQCRIFCTVSGFKLKNEYMLCCKSTQRLHLRPVLAPPVEAGADGLDFSGSAVVQKVQHHIQGLMHMSLLQVLRMRHMPASCRRSMMPRMGAAARPNHRGDPSQQPCLQDHHAHPMQTPNPQPAATSQVRRTLHPTPAWTGPSGSTWPPTQLPMHATPPAVATVHTHPLARVILPASRLAMTEGGAQVGTQLHMGPLTLARVVHQGSMRLGREASTQMEVPPSMDLAVPHSMAAAVQPLRSQQHRGWEVGKGRQWQIVIPRGPGGISCPPPPSPLLPPTRAAWAERGPMPLLAAPAIVLPPVKHPWHPCRTMIATCALSAWRSPVPLDLCMATGVPQPPFSACSCAEQPLAA